jgi:hypothetical protein
MMFMLREKNPFYFSRRAKGREAAVGVTFKGGRLVVLFLFFSVWLNLPTFLLSVCVPPAFPLFGRMQSNQRGAEASELQKTRKQKT